MLGFQSAAAFLYESCVFTIFNKGVDHGILTKNPKGTITSKSRHLLLNSFLTA